MKKILIKMDYGRMIKLLLPTNKFIKIQISGDENELKDLISTVINSTPSQIKGIKDSEGNYYTLSSAIRSSHLLQSNENIYYELILGKPIEKKNEPQKLISLSVNDKNFKNKIILNTSPKVGNYYANYFIGGNNNQLNYNNQLNFHFRKRGLSFDEIREISQQEIQLFSDYLVQFLSLKLINDDMLFKLNKMMRENNISLYREFNLFKIGKINQEKFIRILYTFYNDIKKEKERTKNVLSSSEKNKKVIKGLTDIEDENEYRDKIYEKMKEYFNGENLNIVRLTLKYENENIMKAIKKFKEDTNLINLIESFQKAIRRFKSKTTQNQKFFNTFSLLQNYKPIVKNMEIDFKRREERHHSSPQGTIETEINNHKKILEKKLNNENEKIKTSQFKKHSSKKINNSIQKNLNQYNKHLFNYIYNNNKNEYNSFLNIYNQKNKIENLNKELNDYCQQLIDKEIINYGEKNNILISNSNIEILHNLISKNNLEVMNIFLKLTKHNSINLFCQELISLIQNINYSSNTIRNNKKNENEIILDFFNNLDKINLRKKDKDILNTLLNSKNSKLMSIINEYQKNNNIKLYEVKIRNILKKNTTHGILSNLKIKDSPKKIFKNNLIPGYINKNTSLDKETARLEPKFSNITIQLIQENPTTSFEKALFETNQFNDNEIFFLRKKFSEKNSKILNIYDSYQNQFDKNEFQESIKTFLKKEYKENDNINVNKTQINFPLFLNEKKESRDKLNWIINTENKNTLEKQKEIISLLYNELCIDKNTYDLINKKIDKEDKSLMSAFEVYAITKDHSEFIETLKLIADLVEDYKGIFYHLINISSFNLNQKDRLISLYKDKNKNIFNILKNFENDENVDLAFSSFKNLLSKKN